MKRRSLLRIRRKMPALKKGEVPRRAKIIRKIKRQTRRKAQNQ